MGIKTVRHPPYSLELAPCDLCLFPIMRQLRSKRLWQRSLRSSHKRTSMEPCRSCWNGRTSALQLAEITSKGTRVSCVYYQCEKSLETYLMILVVMVNARPINLIRSKQLSSVPVCHVQCLPDYLVILIQFINEEFCDYLELIYLKKENVKKKTFFHW